MDMNRKRPPKDCDLELWLSGTINDALRDAREAGLPSRQGAFIALSLGGSEARFANIRRWDILRAVGLGTSICSQHQNYDPGCNLCNTTVEAVIPDFAEKLRQARAAGEHKCEHCAFVYFKTLDVCPRCYAPRKSTGDAKRPR
jgi:hypothetical protein